MSGPLVSILIPVYNCEQWISYAIESALAQTWPNKEIVLLDDGSTDRSCNVIAHYEKQVRVESHSNRGQNASRNRLTELSRGEWLVYLDADDELAPDCVARKMELARDAEAVFGTMEWATFQGSNKVYSEIRTAVDYADPWEAFFWWRYPNTSSFVFRRDALLEAGGWDEEVKNCTDYVLYLAMLRTGSRFRAAPESKSLYRNWSEAQATNEAPIRKVRTRLEVMWGAASELSLVGGLTPERKRDFQNATLGNIRILAVHDLNLARQEHQKLSQFDPTFRPSHSIFSSLYTKTYNCFGFETAEWLANLSRPFRRFKKPTSVSRRE